jgi:hypothetical protein
MVRMNAAKWIPKKKKKKTTTTHPATIIAVATRGIVTRTVNVVPPTSDEVTKRHRLLAVIAVATVHLPIPIIDEEV